MTMTSFAHGQKGEMMDDLISRQAAIETALTYIVEYCGAAFDEDMQRMLKERLDSLPSTQQEQFNPCTICQEFDCTGCKFRRT